jgi:hypothetical protein
MNKNITVPDVRQCSFFGKSGRCKHHAIGDGNPFCQEHTDRWGRKSAINMMTEAENVEYTQEEAEEPVEEQPNFLARFTKEYKPILTKLGLRAIPETKEGAE